MSLGATVFKADLHISDMDRKYYHDHSITIARHPSETDERMMVRLLAFALNAHEGLCFTRGIGTTASDEPDIWLKDYTGDIELWIEVGQPDEKRIGKACRKAKQVLVYTYSGRAADAWWAQTRTKVSRYRNLKVFSLSQETSKLLANLAERTMQLQITIHDGQIWVSCKNESVAIELLEK